MDPGGPRPSGGPLGSDVTPVFRSYGSFSQAAEENGLSRILVGFRFRHAGQKASNMAARSAIVP
jgi:hypothetical protein